MANDVAPEGLTRDEVAQMFRVTEWKVRHLVRTGVLREIRLGHRTRRIDAASVRAYLKAARRGD